MSNLSMMLNYFAASEVTVGSTAEAVLVEFTEDVSSALLNFYMPSFCGYYRWTDLAGGNPTCTLKLKAAKIGYGTGPPVDGDYVDKNYVRFDGVDLFKHPVSLVRALIDFSDFVTWMTGITNKTVGWRVVAQSSAGALAIGDRSFAGIFGQKSTLT